MNEGYITCYLIDLTRLCDCYADVLCFKASVVRDHRSHGRANSRQTQSSPTLDETDSTGFIALLSSQQRYTIATANAFGTDENESRNLLLS
jgi:hypothetical protein